MLIAFNKLREPRIKFNNWLILNLYLYEVIFWFYDRKPIPYQNTLMLLAVKNDWTL